MSMYEGNNNNNENNSGNGEYTQSKVYTSGFTLKNFDVEEASKVFEQKWYNDSMSITLYPDLPANLQTEKRKIDYKNGVSTLLVWEKALALYAAYITKFIPALEAGEEYSTSVLIADVNALRISTGVAEHGSAKPYIQIIKGIDPETLQSELEMRYYFKSVKMIENYNPTDGSYGNTAYKYAKLEGVMNNMKEFGIAIGNAQVHASRVVNKFANDRLSGNIEKIGEKVGANIQRKYSGNNSSYRNNTTHSPIFTDSNTQNQVPNAPEQTYSSLSDLDI